LTTPGGPGEPERGALTQVGSSVEPSLLALETRATIETLA